MKNQTKIFWSMTFCTKLLIDAKPLHITFGKVNGFIRDYDGTKYLVLFNLEKYDAIYDRGRSYRVEKWYYTCFFLKFMQKSKLIKMLICL